MTIKNVALNICASIAIFTPLLSFANNTYRPAEPLPANHSRDFGLTEPAKIDWQPCPTADSPTLLCATYAVPLNYQQFNADKPWVTQISISDKSSVKEINLSLIKLPANNPAKKRLGSLFLNPGGPGASGKGLVRFAGLFLFNQDVRDQYDLIGFDPRGIGESEPLTCNLTEADLQANSVPFPTSAEEQSRKFKSDEFINAKCVANAGDIINHMSTADVARDLDNLRAAVGDKLLNYVGYSYGSYLGVTYANLYPEKVGHVVVDGVLDPIAWSTGRGFESWFTPMTTRLGSDKGSLATLNEFFRLCELAGTAGCALAGNAEARYYALLERLKNHPVPVVWGDGHIADLTYDFIVITSVGAMSGAGAWPWYAEFLVGLEAQVSAADLGEKLAKFQRESGYDVVPPEDNYSLSFKGVLCADSDNPLDRQYWPIAAKWSERKNGVFGPYWTWESSTCVGWPASQDSRYVGPFNKWTKNPVLVANTLFDANTPYHGAKAVRKLLPNSRLVTVAGWGHTTPGLSACADAITANYLLRGELPKKDALCKADSTPFDVPVSSQTFSAMAEDVGPLENSAARQVTAQESAKSDGARARKAILGNMRRY